MNQFRLRPLIHLVPIAAALFPAILLCQVIPARQPAVITGSRPLCEFAERLQARHATVITYEDPAWQWRGDLQRLSLNPTPVSELIPAVESFAPPPSGSSTSPGEILDNAVRAFNGQTRGPHFQMSSSKLGLHLFPAEEHNASGQLVSASNILDSLISVPTVVRTASGHFAQICAAASAASGAGVECSAAGVRPWLDETFAANPKPFAWGVNGISARGALVDLILKSATTITWEFLCGATADWGAAGRSCVLNLRPLVVDDADAQGSPTRTPLYFDRCGECPRPNRPPPPPR